MPSVISHSALPLAAAYALGHRVISKRLMVAGVLASVIPDADILAFHFGIPYASEFGHRGFSHSLLFAIVLGLLAAYWHRALRSRMVAALAFVALAAASHGLLDTLTDGGLGIALLWPYSTERFFAPIRPIEVSPIGISSFLTERGLRVLKSEGLWIWLPAVLSAISLAAFRRRFAKALRLKRSRRR